MNEQNFFGKFPDFIKYFDITQNQILYRFDSKNERIKIIRFSFSLISSLLFLGISYSIAYYLSKIPNYKSIHSFKTYPHYLNICNDLDFCTQFDISFSFKIKNSTHNIPILIDQKYFDLIITQYSQIEGVTQFNSKNYTYKVCDNSDFSDYSDFPIPNNLINSSYCIDYDYTLFGIPDLDKSFSYLNLKVSKCVNSTISELYKKNNIICNSPSNIDTYLNELIVEVNYIHRDIVDINKNDFRTVVRTESFPLLSNFSLRINFETELIRFERNTYFSYTNSSYLTLQYINSEINKLDSQNLLSFRLKFPTSFYTNNFIHSSLIYMISEIVIINITLYYIIQYILLFILNKLQNVDFAMKLYYLVSPSNTKILKNFEEFISNKYNQLIIKNFNRIIKPRIEDFEINIEELEQIDNDPYFEDENEKNKTTFFDQEESPEKSQRNYKKKKTLGYVKPSINTYDSIKRKVKRASTKVLKALERERFTSSTNLLQNQIDLIQKNDEKIIDIPLNEEKINLSNMNKLEDGFKNENMSVLSNNNEKKKINQLKNRSDIKSRTNIKKHTQLRNNFREILRENERKNSKIKHDKQENIVIMNEEEKKIRKDLIKLLKELRVQQVKEIMDGEYEEFNGLEDFFKGSKIEEFFYFKSNQRRLKVKEIIQSENIKLEEDKEGKVNKVFEDLQLKYEKYLQIGKKSKDNSYKGNKGHHYINSNSNFKDNFESIEITHNRYPEPNLKIFDIKTKDFKEINYFEKMLNTKDNKLNFELYNTYKLIYDISKLELFHEKDITWSKLFTYIFCHCFFRKNDKKILTQKCKKRKKFIISDFNIMTIAQKLNSKNSDISKLGNVFKELTLLLKVIYKTYQIDLFRTKVNNLQIDLDSFKSPEFVSKGNVKLQKNKKEIESEVVFNISRKIENLFSKGFISAPDKRLLLNLGIPYENIVKIQKLSNEKKIHNKKKVENFLIEGELNKNFIYNQTMKRFLNEGTEISSKI